MYAQLDVWLLCANLYDLFLPSYGLWEKEEKSTQHAYEKCWMALLHWEFSN